MDVAHWLQHICYCYQLYQQFLGAHKHVIVEVSEMKITIDK
jgi:hypothetical protein